MITKIKCPKCTTEGSISLTQSNYEGPYRCWKCHELFTIDIKNGKLESCKPLSQKEFERQKEIEELKSRFKHHGDSS